MRVDVVIPTHGEGEYLAEAIDSALGQTHRDLTLTVMDNGPGGGHAQRVVDRYRSDPRVHYQATGGVPIDENWTRCLQAGDSPLVVLLTHDDVLEREYLGRRVDALLAHPECAFAFSGSKIIDERGERIGTATPPLGRAGVLRPEEFVPILYEANQIPTSSIVLRRSALEAVGPRFSWQWRMGMDWEMWMRLAVRFPVVYLALTDSAYRWHGASESSRSRDWGEMRLTMARRSDELIAAHMPGFRMPPAVRARTLASAHLNIAFEAMERGDQAATARSLRIAVRLHPATAISPRVAAGLVGLLGGDKGKRVVLWARRMETRFKLRHRVRRVVWHAARLVRRDASAPSPRRDR